MENDRTRQNRPDGERDPQRASQPERPVPREELRREPNPMDKPSQAEGERNPGT
jgi:hypothetical protein